MRRDSSGGFVGYLWRRRNIMALAAVAITALFVLSALAAPLLFDWSRATQVNLGSALLTPSSQHWLGTDELGRDMLARVVWGARVTLIVAVCSVLLAMVVGVAIGTLCGFYDGRLSNLVMRFTDFMIAFPRTLFAIMIITVAGNSIVSLTLAIGISTIPIYIRLFRAPVLALRSREFVVAARSMGASDLRLMVSHILPNTVSLMIVQGTIALAEAILIGSGLSFLGLGPQPPTPEWGAMIAGSRAYIASHPHVILAPGLALFFVILSFNLVGDALRDYVDPRSRARR